MYDIQYKTRTELEPNLYRHIHNEITKSFRWNIDENTYDTDGLMFLPLALDNKEKGLRAGHRRQPLVESSPLSTYNWLLADFLKETENPSLTVQLCRRGWTFMDKYCRERFTYLDKESLYCQVDVNHRIRIFKNKKNVYIVTNNMNDTISKTIFSALPLLFKEEFTWSETTLNFHKYFAKKEEQEVVKDYIKLVNKTKIPEQIRQLKLRKNIEKVTNTQLRILQQEKQAVTDRIKSYETSLEQSYLELTALCAKITFYTPAENQEEVCDYIQKNPYIVDYFSPDDETLVLAIEAPLEYIDTAAFKQMLKNPTSYLYPRASTDHGDHTWLTKNHPNEFIIFLKDLFLSGKYKVYSRSEIALNFKENRAYPFRRSSKKNTRPKTWYLSYRYNNEEKAIVPHMHIEYYDCWAGNKTNIAKALNKSDLISAIDICVNTTKDINVNDGAVFKRFITQCLVRPTEFNDGHINDVDAYEHWEIPGNQYKTIYDTEKKIFRTFFDIFTNDYLKDIPETNSLTQENDITEYI